MKIKHSLIALFAFISLSANAGFLVEPYLGYKIGTGDQGGSTPVDYTYSGATFGGRLGYQFLGLMGGLDYSLSSFDIDREVPGTKTSVDTSQSTFGAFVGYDFPILLRAWAAYYFSSKLEENDNDEYSGGGYGLGVGFTGLPFVSLNIEYRSLAYDEFYNSSASSTSSLGADVEINEILFSVSLPLDL